MLGAGSRFLNWLLMKILFKNFAIRVFATFSITLGSMNSRENDL